jgi:NAD(P)H-dependent flavin oxidoreductase YrpB (nitropropane dioxygenase family)
VFLLLTFIIMPSSEQIFSTNLTKLFKINHPVMLAGMNVAAGPKLAAAVTNSGGIGVIGGVRQTPKFLKGSIEELKSHLEDKNAPFGVDLLLPQVGGNARKTNKDYTEGQLPELVDVIIEGGAKLFVTAVGVPPKWVVDKFHAAGIPVMNMIGHPKHVAKCIAAGVDIIGAQGGEGGGHTGDTAFSILIPAVVDLCKNAKSPLTGEPLIVVAAGGIADGRGLAAALAYAPFPRSILYSLL